MTNFDPTRAPALRQPESPRNEEPPHQAQKTLQKLASDDKNEVTVLIERGVCQQRERILPRRSYQMIEKLSEFLEFLAVLNAETNRHSKS